MIKLIIACAVPVVVLGFRLGYRVGKSQRSLRSGIVQCLDKLSGPYRRGISAADTEADRLRNQNLDWAVHQPIGEHCLAAKEAALRKFCLPVGPTINAPSASVDLGKVPVRRDSHKVFGLISLRSRPVAARVLNFELRLNRHALSKPWDSQFQLRHTRRGIVRGGVRLDPCDVVVRDCLRGVPVYDDHIVAGVVMVLDVP